MAGLTETIASFVVDTPPGDISEAAIDKAKKALADTAGVILAGSASEVVPPILKYLAQSGTEGAFPILGTALTTSAEMAAFVNGTLAHALDFDDVLSMMTGHPSAVILPALLAAVEPGVVDGRALLEAYVVGIEVGAKIGHGLGIGQYYRGWHSTGTVGVLAATAAVARLRRLDVPTTRQALGIAASTASGLQRNFGTMTKPFHAGWAARNAVAAVHLVSVGFRAAPDVLEARAGFFALYGDGQSDANRTAEHLGRPYAVVDPGLSLKKHPCCYVLHRPIDGVLTLRRRHGLSAENVDSVLCLVPPGGLKPIIYSRPETGLQGKFCLEYVLAAGVLDGKLVLSTFTDEAVHRPAIEALLRRIEKREDPRCSAEDPLAESRSSGTRGFVEVHVTTKQGETVVARVDAPPGSPQRELSWEDVREKFFDCASYAGIDAGKVEPAWQTLRNLEESADVAETLRLLQRSQE